MYKIVVYNRFCTAQNTDYSLSAKDYLHTIRDSDWEHQGESITYLSSQRLLSGLPDPVTLDTGEEASTHATGRLGVP